MKTKNLKTLAEFFLYEEKKKFWVYITVADSINHFVSSEIHKTYNWHPIWCREKIDPHQERHRRPKGRSHEQNATYSAQRLYQEGFWQTAQLQISNLKNCKYNDINYI